MIRRPPRSTLFSLHDALPISLDSGRDYLAAENVSWLAMLGRVRPGVTMEQVRADLGVIAGRIDQQHPGRTTSLDRKSTRLNSSHLVISYAVFCLKKKKN